MAVAAGIGLGVASSEIDVAGGVFSWRHVLGGVAVIAVVLGVLPVEAKALGRALGETAGQRRGAIALYLRWTRPNDPAAYRVLWLGDLRALALGGWSVDPGLSYALSGETTPDTTAVWTPAGPGPADTAAIGLRLALQGNTVHLGRLLAPLGVRYVVVLEGIDPGQPGSGPGQRPAAQRLAAVPARPRRPPGGAGPGGRPGSTRTAGTGSPSPPNASFPALLPSPLWDVPSAEDMFTGWRPVLTPLADHHVATGTSGQRWHRLRRLRPGRELHAAGRWPHRGAPTGASDGPVNSTGALAGQATLAFHGLPYVPFFVLVEVAGWLALALALLGWRRRSPAAPPEPTPAADPAPALTPAMERS